MKIPCVVLVYDNVKIFDKFITNLIFLKDALDIYVVENKSKDSGRVGNLCQKLLEGGLIKKHIAFEEDISNNAVEVVFKDNLIDLSSEYVIVTDGDLVPDKGWLKEHHDILRNNHDVFVVGNSLKMDNLPLETFPHADLWVPRDYADCGDYFWAKTGTHFLTFRTFEFEQFLTKLGPSLKFCDTNIHLFSEHIGKKSARTKNTSSVHLTWDIYNDINHPYTRFKLDNQRLRNHGNYCNYEVYE